MENASKALLMAGGVLIAILILSLLVYMATTTSRLAEAQDEKTLAQQTAAFNSEYEAYNKTRMYGTDIITVVKKADDYNIKTEADGQSKIDIKIFDATGNEISISYESEFKIGIFKCTKIEYNQTTGRINLMEFTKIK